MCKLIEITWDNEMFLKSLWVKKLFAKKRTQTIGLKRENGA